MLPIDDASIEKKIKYCETAFDFKQDDKAN